MERLRRAIQYKDGWNFLIEEIDEIDRIKTKDPARGLEFSKSILEKVSIKIAKDRGVVIDKDLATGSIIKKAFEILPVVKFLDSKDEEASKAVLNAFATIATRIGEFRNKYGPISHGKDLYADRIDNHALLFSIDSCDLVASYLAKLDSFDVSERTRIEYDDYPFFNKKIDDEQDDQPIVSGILLSPSRSLFGADFESYKEKLYEHETEKKASITDLCNSNTYIKTRKICSDLNEIRDYLTDDEVKQLCAGFTKNDQVYDILKHGHTKNLYEWIINEKSTILEEGQLKEMVELKQKAIY